MEARMRSNGNGHHGNGFGGTGSSVRTAILPDIKPQTAVAVLRREKYAGRKVVFPVENCHLCQSAGHPSPAHRIVNGKGVCRDHYAGALIPGQPISNGAAHELPKENGMRAKIDRDELRKLHAEGLNDVQTAAKLGCSAVGVPNSTDCEDCQ